jgi:hypothetical protein
MKDDPHIPEPTHTLGTNRKREALERIVELYEAWDAAEAEKGYDAKAAEWRAKLAEFDRTTPQPTATAPAPAGSAPDAESPDVPPRSLLPEDVNEGRPR